MKNITYINKKYINHDNAKVSVEDRGFLFGDSIYELISVADKEIIDIDQHLSRLKISLKKIKLKYNFKKQNFLKIIKRLIKTNNIVKIMHIEVGINWSGKCGNQCGKRRITKYNRY